MRACTRRMFGVVLCLLAVFVAGLVLAGGPTLWFALVVGAAVFGGDPSDPSTALFAAVLAFLVATVLREALARRRR